jgi:hypothetical protein
MPHFTVINVSMKLDLRRKRRGFFGNVDNNAYAFEVVLRLPEDNKNISDIEDVILSEGEKPLGPFVNLSTNGFKITIKMTRSHLFSN